MRWRWKRTTNSGNAGAAQVTVYYFTWNDEQSGQAVQALRPATVSAILAAGGEPITNSAHQVPASEINALGFKRRPVRRCDACGELLVYQGSWLDGSSLDGPQPRRDQTFGCPWGHEVWAFVDPALEWRRRWADSRGEHRESAIGCVQRLFASPEQ